VVSTRAAFLENRLGVDESARRDIRIGRAESFVKGRTIDLVEPITRIERQEFDFVTVQGLSHPRSSDATG
jgi:hypothetical protein